MDRSGECGIIQQNRGGFGFKSAQATVGSTLKIIENYDLKIISELFKTLLNDAELVAKRGPEGEPNEQDHFLSAIIRVKSVII